MLLEESGMAKANPQGPEKWGPELEIQSPAMYLSTWSRAGVLGWGCGTPGNRHSGTDRIQNWLWDGATPCRCGQDNTFATLGQLAWSSGV